MIIPVRCYTCGKVIGNKWEKYKNMIKNETNPIVVLSNLGFKRWCCRRMILGHVELIDKILKYDLNQK